MAFTLLPDEVPLHLTSRNPVLNADWSWFREMVFAEVNALNPIAKCQLTMGGWWGTPSHPSFEISIAWRGRQFARCFPDRSAENSRSVMVCRKVPIIARTETEAELRDELRHRLRWMLGYIRGEQRAEAREIISALDVSSSAESSTEKS